MIQRLCSTAVFALGAFACVEAPAPKQPPPAAPQSAPVPAENTPTMPEPANAESELAPIEPTGSQTPRGQICPAGPHAQNPLVETQAKLLQQGFVFVEGPVWSDRLGGLLFSEMDFNADGSQGPPAKIHLLRPDGSLRTFMESSGSNGLAIDETGLVAATHDNQALSRIDLATRQRTALVPSVDGKKFNSPNDLSISGDGHIYFSDPDWQLGRRESETKLTGVYWVTPDGKVNLVDGTLDKPNGVSLSPDDKTLYVGSRDGNVWSYAIKDGKPQNRQPFAKVDGPDGMAVDCAGNLYVTSHGPGKVEVFSKNKQRLGSIEVAPKTTNAAFGGPERKTLFITAGSGVYSVETAVPGYPY